LLSLSIGGGSVIRWYRFEIGMEQIDLISDNVRSRAVVATEDGRIEMKVQPRDSFQLEPYGREGIHVQSIER